MPALTPHLALADSAVARRPRERLPVSKVGKVPSRAACRTIIAAILRRMQPRRQRHMYRGNRGGLLNASGIS